MIKDIATLFERDLKNLETSISRYKNDEDLWIKKKDIPNSGGNLCLHICGNLNYYIGSILGKTGYIRNREAEFTDSDKSISDLIILIQKTSTQVKSSLESLSEELMDEAYPLPFHGEKWSNAKFLLHLYGHLHYHMGQIDYHRRGVI